MSNTLACVLKQIEEELKRYSGEGLVSHHALRQSVHIRGLMRIYERGNMPHVRSKCITRVHAYEERVCVLAVYPHASSASLEWYCSTHIRAGGLAVVAPFALGFFGGITGEILFGSALSLPPSLPLSLSFSRCLPLARCLAVSLPLCRF
eukprot:3902303-Rhodomonas_salina.1